MTLSRGSSVAALALACACGASTARVDAPHLAAADPGRWPSPLGAPVDEPWVIAPSTSAGDYHVIAHEGAATLVLANGTRARVDASGVHAASTSTLVPLVNGARIGGDWAFAYSGGAILRAEGDYLGPLTVAASTPFGISRAVAGDGVLTLQFQYEGFHRFDARGLAPIVVPDLPPEAILDVVLPSATTAYAVVVPGTLLRSTDGTTYSPVDLGDRVAVAVELAPGSRVRVRTLFEILDLDDEGHIAATVPNDTPIVELPAAPSELVASLVDDEASRHPFDGAGAIGPTGRVLRRVDAGAPVVWDPSRGIVHLAAAGEACTYELFGASVLAVCGDGPSGVYVSDDLAAFAHLGDVWRADDHVRSSRDGSSFVFVGHCDPRTLAAAGGANGNAQGELPLDTAALRDATVLCWHDGTHFRERALPAATTIADILREHVLLDGGADGGLQLLDLTSDAPPIRVELPADVQWSSIDPGFTGDGWVQVRVLPAVQALTIDGAELTGDGWIVVRMHDGDVRSMLVGPREGPLVRRMLPPGTVDANLADRAHGLAIGATVASVQTTSDGGASWTPATLPWQQGEPSAYPSSSYPLTGTVRCGPGGCVSAGSVAFVPARLLAHTAAPADAAVLFPTYHAYSMGRPNPDQGRWSCAAPTPSPRPARARPPAGALFTAAHAEDSDAWHIAGFDARGAFGWDASSGNGGHGFVVGATRRFALFLSPSWDSPSALYVMRPGQAPAPLVIDALAPEGLGRNGYPAFVLPDGGIATVLDLQRSWGRTQRSVLVHVGADGTLAEATLMAIPRPLVPMEAVLASGEVGVAIRFGDDLYFYGPTHRAQRLAPWTDDALPCGAGRPSARVHLALEQRAGVMVGDTYAMPIDTGIAVVNGALCVETMHAADAGRDFTWAFLIASSGRIDGYVGTADVAGTAAAITCHATRAGAAP
jgi:hypothetical protein